MCCVCVVCALCVCVCVVCVVCVLCVLCVLCCVNMHIVCVCMFNDTTRKSTENHTKIVKWKHMKKNLTKNGRDDWLANDSCIKGRRG